MLGFQREKPPVYVQELKPLPIQGWLDALAQSLLERAAPSKGFPCDCQSKLCLGLTGTGSRKGLEKCIY